MNEMLKFEQCKGLRNISQVLSIDNHFELLERTAEIVVFDIKSRTQEINDALDILSSCFQEIDKHVANDSGFTQKSLEINNAVQKLDHAMSYLEKEYTI